MKFKVGDKVRIKNNLKDIEDFYGGYTKSLQKHVGEICTVKRGLGNGRAVDLKENGWTWDIRALELVERKQFTKSDLKDGDIVTYRNGQQRIIIGKKLIDKNGDITSETDYYKEDLTKILARKEYEIVKVERTTQYETVFERKEEILDKAEKRYLSNVIRPFRKDFKYIVKRVSSLGSKEFIYIGLENNRVLLPYFKPNTMYKGMKIDKEYTLEELNL